MRQRRGFTMVEMLVSTALIAFIMVVLAEAFQLGMNTFRQLKVIGDLQEKLRMATGILRKDLAADHFEGKKRLSDTTFWLNGPPREGFFRILQIGPSIPEGQDDDGNWSFRATNHFLHFTVKRRANKREEFAVGAINAAIDPTSPLPFVGLGGDSRYQQGGTFSSQWYEVAYFLVASGRPTPGGTPLFNLYRRQRLLIANPWISYTNSAMSTQQININYDPTPPNPPGPTPPWVTPVSFAPVNKLPAYTEISCMQNPDANFANQIYFNSPADVTIPQRRFGMNPGTAANVYGGVFLPGQITYPILFDNAGNPTSADLLLPNVISFDVRVLVPPTLAQPNPDFADLQNISGVGQNPQFPGSLTSPGLPAVFDTWSSMKDDVYDYSTWSQTGASASTATVPAPIQVQALQISIRIWDVKTLTTRQASIVQEM